MKIERFKSILLIMLVISSIVLTANNWFNKKLWPEGYSFFSDIKNHFATDNKNNSKPFNPNEEILKPSKIILNDLSNHVLYTKSSDKYIYLYNEITSILEKAFSSTNINMADIEEWNNHLKTTSCYFSYPVMYDATYFTSHLSKSYHGKTKYFREFVVAFDQVVPSTMYVYVKDAESEAIEKIKFDYNGNIINEIIADAGNDSNDINYFSFELNFDNADGDIVKDHVVIDDDVLINISPKNIRKIRENNLFYDIANNDALYTDILSEFNYNASGIRKYIEADNSIVFVENYGTLKLHSNGVMEYKALEDTNGISLEGSSVNECLNSCITFVNKLTSLINMNGMYYEITSDIHDISSKSFTLTFDYFINDNMIIIPEDIYSSKNAITVSVVNGKIVSYTQLFKSFDIFDEKTGIGSAIDAIDMIEYEKQGKNEVISDIFSAYSYNKSTASWLPQWYVENSDGDISTITMNTEVQ